MQKFSSRGWFETLFIGSGFIAGKFAQVQVDDQARLHSDVNPFLSLLRVLYPSWSWQKVAEHSLTNIGLHLLGMEVRMGPRKCLFVSVVFARKMQVDEEDMFNTPMENHHRSFLRAMAEERAQ